MDILSYIDKTPTIAHLVEISKNLLLGSDYVELNENDEWNTIPDKFFICHLNESIAIFKVANTNNGLIVAVNGDSPCFKIKPNTHIIKNCEQLILAPHGLGLWFSWLDRDLTISGKVLFQKNGKKESKLIHCDSTVTEIPSIASHLSHNSITTNFDLEKHFNSVISVNFSDPTNNIVSPKLLEIIAKECSCNVSDIIDFDISIVSAEKAAKVGINDEFLNSQRISTSVPSILSLMELISSEPPTDGFRSLYITSENEKTNFIETVLTRIGIDKRSFRKVSIISVSRIPGSAPNHTNEVSNIPLGSGVFYVQSPSNKFACDQMLINKIISMAKSFKLNNVQIKDEETLECSMGKNLMNNLGTHVMEIGFPILGLNTIRETAAVCDIKTFNSILHLLFNGELFKN